MDRHRLLTRSQPSQVGSTFSNLSFRYYCIGNNTIKNTDECQRGRSDRQGDP